MKQVAITLVCITLCITSFSAPLLRNILLLNTSELSAVLSAPIDKKQTVLKEKPKFKQKLLLKLIRKNADDAQKKKSVRILGILSFGISLLSILLFFIGMFSNIFGIAIVGLALSLIAFILGLLSLTRRSKLKDKSGTRKWAGLLGMIIGSGFLIGIAIAILITLYS